MDKRQKKEGRAIWVSLQIKRGGIGNLLNKDIDFKY